MQVAAADRRFHLSEKAQDAGPMEVSRLGTGFGVTVVDVGFGAQGCVFKGFGLRAVDVGCRA